MMSTMDVPIDEPLVSQLDALQEHIAAILDKNRFLELEIQNLRQSLQLQQQENAVLQHKWAVIISRVESMIARIPIGIPEEMIAHGTE